MDLKVLFDGIMALGAVATGLSAYFIYKTYQRSKEEKQVENLKEAILTFQLNFQKIYRDFDKSHLISQVEKVVHNDDLIELVKSFYDRREIEEREFSAFVNDQKIILSNILISSLYVLDHSEIQKALESSLFSTVRIKTKYPILHNYIEGINSIINHAVNIFKKESNLENKLCELFVSFYKNKEYEQKGVQGIKALFSQVILNSFQQKVDSQNLNELLFSIRELNEYIFDIYLNRSVHDVYLMSKEEISTEKALYDSGSISKDIWLFLEVKSKYLGSKRTEAQYHVNIATTYLKTE